MNARVHTDHRGTFILVVCLTTAVFYYATAAHNAVTTANGEQNRQGRPTMDQYIRLYSWMRGGNSISIASITQVQTLPSLSGKESVELQLKIVETLWNGTQQPPLRYDFLQSAGQAARIKFPDPVWGLVTLKKDVLLLLISSGTSVPTYVEEIPDPKNPVLQSLRVIVSQEKSGIKPLDRLSRYFAWLEDGSVTEKLFAAEALTKDEMPEVDAKGEIAGALARTFAEDADRFVRISVGTLMWQNIYSRSNTKGQLAIINATIRGAEGSDEDVQRFALDRLEEADPEMLRRAVVGQSPIRAVQLLRDRRDKETDANVRKRLRAVITALQ